MIERGEEIKIKTQKKQRDPAWEWGNPTQFG